MIRYQMNPANYREALIETRLDEAEGADILMVRYASFYQSQKSWRQCLVQGF